MKKIIAVLLTLVSLNSCFSTQSKEIIQTRIPILEIQHGGCYGTCPIYTLSLYNDRLVRYHGKRFVEQEGVYKGYLSKVDYTKVINWSKTKFTKSEDINIEVQDLPRTVIKYNEHKIQFKGRAPEHYQQTILDIEDILLNSINWKDLE